MMTSKMDSKSPAVSGTKDPLQFPNLIIGRLPEKKEDLENQVAFFKRNFGYKDQAAHGEKVHCMAWNKEGTLLATGSYDKTVVLFAFAKDGKMYREYSLKGHNHSVDQLAWHPTKPDLLLTYSSDKTVRLWNVRQRVVLQTYSMKGEAVSLCWAPDGKSFALGDKEDTLTFIETEKGQKFERTFLYEVNEMVFRQHHDRTYLFLTTGLPGCQSGRLEYFEYKFPELIPIHVIPVSGQTSTCIDMDPRCKYLAIGGTDSNVTLWDLNGLFPVQEITRQKQAIRRISFSHDSRFVASMAEESYIDVGFVESGEKVWSFQNDERDDRESVSLVELAFHPKRLVLAAAYDCKRSHKDQSFIRLFGVSAVSDAEKKNDHESRGRSREKEKISKEEVKDGAGKPRFESKFSFLRPTADQLAGLEERKVAQAAREAKAAILAAQRAAAAAAKLPVRVPTRLGVQAQRPTRSGIREPIRPPSAAAKVASDSAAPSPLRSRDGSSASKKEEERKPMAPPVVAPQASSNRESTQSRSVTTVSRKGDVEESGSERKRVRSSNREADVKDSPRSSSRTESKK